MRNRTRSSVFAALLLASSVFSPGTGSAEPLIQPDVAVSEEYNDNILLQPSDKEVDFITRVLPSVRFLYKAPLWDWDAAYTYDYRRYAHHRDVDDTTQTATITNTTRLINEFLFLDARDEYSRVSLSVARDYTQESLFVNQSDRNILQLNPYAVFHTSPTTTLTTGYTYRNIWFEDPTAVDKIDQIVSIDAWKEASKRLTLTASLKQSSDTNRIENYRKSDLLLGPRYEYAENSYLWFFIGGTRLDFEKTGDARQFTWDAGISYKRPSYALSFETALNYVDDPLSILQREDRYVATIKSGSERTFLALSTGLLEYRQAVSQELEERTYRMSAAFGHEITRTWRGSFELSVERFSDLQAGTLSVRTVSDVRFDYQSTEKLTFSIEHRYTDSYSHDLDQQSYGNNRVIAEAKYAF